MDEQWLELASRARQSDADAFGELIRHCERTALAVAFAQVGSGDQAADAVQEAFLKAWRSVATLEDPARFTGWLCGIVRNVAIDHRRRMKPTASAGGAAVGVQTVGDPLTDLGRAETRGHVAVALAALDDVSRSAVVLRYYEGLSSREIAAVLGLSVAATDMRLARARKELKQRLAGVTEAGKA